MRKVVVYELLSLDGVAEDPDEFMDWDDGVEADLTELIAAQDAVILGRRSYDEWAAFWPTSDIEPFAGFINGVAKHVATSTPFTREWARTTVIDGDPVDYVRTLKSQDGGDIGVHASITLARDLIAAGVVDELAVVIAPVIRGTKRRLLDGLEKTKLTLLRSTTSERGNLIARYRLGD
ncbi:MAG TPA: dihydrofolate reductase family protein [Mycobacteriales bacterium]|nr:dihydrofolate reductase family protein [Mycobacteriales bacterium]